MLNQMKNYELHLIESMKLRSISRKSLHLLVVVFTFLVHLQNLILL